MPPLPGNDISHPPTLVRRIFIENQPEVAALPYADSQAIKIYATISPCKTFRGCERLLSQHSANLDILIYTEIFRCENEKTDKTEEICLRY